MDARKERLFQMCIVIAVLASLLSGGKPAYAHKLKIFATAEAKTISGYAYLSGGGRPRNVTIEVRGPKGEKLHEVTTNDKGEFTFEAKCKCDHVLVLETADGHGARFVVKAEELPDDLPGPSGEPAAKPADDAPKPKANEIRGAGTAVSTAEIEKIVAKAVSKQINPLREQLDRYEEKVRLHDILGGIGYIVGIVGLTFYFLGVRKKERQDSSE